MKDLLLYVADADAEAWMRSLLNRPQALGIRPITFAIERHTYRDPGMVRTGAELARMQKGQYQKALLVWDHQGSGREHRRTPIAVRQEVQEKLNACTWKANSAVSIVVPELEQWLWYCESALLAHCGLAANQLADWLQDRSDKLGTPVDNMKRDNPKELFEYVMRKRLKRTISPRDFEQIARRASVSGLQRCDSFHAIVETMQAWFPDSEG